MNLKQDYTEEIIQLQPDYEGEVVAVLISSKRNQGDRSSLLYIHGFIDYFFHPHLGKECNDQGYDFYALDLRKHGRSLLPHQHPNYCKRIDEYFEEITLTIQKIKSENHSVFLLAHSTGGLTASLYMNKGKARHLVNGLILNSPFLDINLPPLQKRLTIWASNVVSQFSDYAKVNGAISPAYAQSVHKDYFGEWDFNTSWKPIKGFPAFFKWFVAIVKAQRELNKSNIQVPILILHSSGSLRMNKYKTEAMTHDIVLNVEDIKRVGKHLGSEVKFCCIENAMHDVFLSSKEVREKSMTELFSWLNGN
jgi:alpha-beta hydrolase superfamily lysophospholipase